jgi:hypothetical protein
MARLGAAPWPAADVTASPLRAPGFSRWQGRFAVHKTFASPRSCSHHATAHRRRHRNASNSQRKQVRSARSQRQLARPARSCLPSHPERHASRQQSRRIPARRRITRTASPKNIMRDVG